MGIRAKVKKGYSFIGKGTISHSAGTVFENISKEEIADQMWKLDILPSRKADEPGGITDAPAKKVAVPAVEVEEESFFDFLGVDPKKRNVTKITITEIICNFLII